MIELRDQPFDPAEALQALETAAPGAGGLVSFTGRVRPDSAKGTVQRLHLQAYSPLTERGIENAHRAAMARWPLLAAHIIHRVGDMTADEAIVFVGTASAHRRAAFEAADFLMDYLKTEAVFWKKELTDQGAHWIEPRQEDYQDQARWSVTGDD